MKTRLVSLLILLTSVQVSAQIGDDFKLPKTWTKDFIITLSYSGSMDGSNTKLTFTHDSCTYIRNSAMSASKNNVYVLTESDRVAILKKLQELKVDNIHSEANMAPVDDGWSMLLCFGFHCIDGGTSARMSDHDKDIFSTAYGYLEEFAVKKDKH